MSTKKGYSFGTPPKIYSTTIEKFKGVDYQSSPVSMDIARSPSAMNMIISQTGFPEKRMGYELLHKFPERINGIHSLKVGNEKKILVHSGENLFLWGDSPSLIASDMADSRSVAFQKNKVLYILDGKFYRCYNHDGTYSLKKVSEVAKVPLTVAARKPDGTGGATIDPVNLLGDQRANSFASTATDKIFVLDSKDITDVVKAEKLGADGAWTVLTGYTVDKQNGKVTFTTAPGATPITGQDNIKITFRKTVEGYEDKINHCSIFDIYTIGTGDYIFLSGNKEFRNQDFRGYVNDPTYFPDTNYSTIGQDNTAIMAYVKINGQQAIIKESNQQDVSIYFRSSRLESDGVSFPLVQGIAGTGAVSKYCTVSLRDDNLYLASDGLTSINTTILGTQMSQNRSYYVNPHLTKQNLTEAVAIEYESKLYIAVDGNCYVADSRRKEYQKNAFAESYQYEFCHWSNIPARVWFKGDNGLCFGDSLGNVFQFYKEHNSATGEGYKDNGVPIEAHWDTPFLDFDTLSRNKTLKNLFLVLQPNIRTSCDVHFRGKGIPLRQNTPDRTVEVTKYADLFDWDNIDFGRFSFVSDDAPIVLPTATKVKRFMLLQVRFGNKLPEPFGLYKVQLDYTVNGKYKG